MKTRESFRLRNQHYRSITPKKKAKKATNNSSKPDEKWLKDDIIKWLSENNIEHDPGDTKAVLLSKI